MEKSKQHCNISRNNWTYYQKITPNISNTSDIVFTNYNNSINKQNKGKSLRNFLFKEESKLNYNKDEKHILNFSKDKVIDENTINNNDIKFAFEKSNKENFNSNKILDNYIIRLKNFGFPELGKIYLSSDISEQEKTFNFFDFLISKEAEYLEKNKTKTKDKLEQGKKYKDLKNKIFLLSNELNIKEKELFHLRKNSENKVRGLKNLYENQLSLITKDNEYLAHMNNKISSKKKNLEFKLYSLNKTINKFQNMKSNIINAVEVIDKVQNSDMAKMVNKVKNTEKLIEKLKSEYNESLKELSFQISCFKKLILEIHNGIIILIENPYNIENSINDFPFLELISHLKIVFKKNLQLLRQKLYMNDFDELT